MTREDLSALARAYVAHFSEPHVQDKERPLPCHNSSTEWASEQVVDMTYENPELLWEIVLEVLSWIRRPPSKKYSRLGLWKTT